MRHYVIRTLFLLGFFILCFTSQACSSGSSIQGQVVDYYQNTPIAGVKIIADTKTEILEEKKLLMHLFETTQENKSGVIIMIGGENRDGQLKSFSVVKTKYHMGNMEGSLGIIGPKRMPYPFLVSAVDYTAKLLGELYSK